MGNIAQAWFVSALFWATMFYFYLKQLLTEKWFNFITVLLIFFSYTFTANNTTIPSVTEYNFINMEMLRAIGGIGLSYLIYQLTKNYMFNCSNKFQKIIATGFEIYLLAFCIYYTVFHKMSFNNYMIYVLAFTALILLSLYKQSYVSLFFDNKLSCLSGIVSYSIFIMHIIVIDLIRNNVWNKNPEALSAHPYIYITLILCISSGIITYYAVERPLTRYLTNKFITSKKNTVSNNRES